MKLSWPSIAVIMVLLVALVAVLSRPGVAFVQSQSTRMAVIDVMKLYDELEERAALDIEQQNRRHRLEEERQRRMGVIQDLERDMEPLTPNSTAWENAQAKLVSELAQFRAWQEIEMQMLQRDMAVRIRAMEGKMLQAIEEVARDNGVQLVVHRETDIPLGDQRQMAQQPKFNLKIVLYADDALDITQAVAQRMNNQFRLLPRE